MKLAGKLKLLLEQHGLTQSQLAKKTGVSQNTISKIASGRTQNSRHLPAIAKAFELSVEELLDEKDHPPPEISPTKARLLRKIENANDSALCDIENAVDAIIKTDEVKKNLGI